MVITGKPMERSLLAKASLSNSVHVAFPRSIVSDPPPQLFRFATQHFAFYAFALR